MSTDQEPSFSIRNTQISQLDVAHAIHTLLFSVFAFVAMFRSATAMLVMYPSFWAYGAPATNFQQNGTLASIGLFISMALQVAAIHLHVRSQLNARIPGRGRAHAVNAFAALLLLLVTLGISAYGLA